MTPSTADASTSSPNGRRGPLPRGPRLAHADQPQPGAWWTSTGADVKEAIINLDPSLLAVRYDSVDELVRKVQRRLRILTLRNSKLAKSDDSTIDASLEFASSDSSGYQVCQHRSPGCEAACIVHSGNGRFAPVKRRRVERTTLFFKQRKRFSAFLHHDIALLRGCADLLPGAPPSIHVRLNTFSDLPWERISLYPDAYHPLPAYAHTAIAMLYQYDVHPYDYSASFRRSYDALGTGYHLTFSRKETTPNHLVKRFLDAGGTVTIPFEIIPETWEGYPVLVGDDSDQRYLDPPGHVIGLTPRGRGRSDRSGFVVR